MAHLLRCFAAWLCLFAASSVALATDRYYSDQTATSPNGRFVANAKSPTNVGPTRRPFASNFEYTLTDTQTNKVLWKRSQPMARSKGSYQAYPDEGSPTRLFVHDSGIVVAALAHESLLILDATSGHKRAEVPLLEAFPKEQQAQFVGMSTAGPIWKQRSEWFFLEVPDAKKTKLYFVVRPFWGHRLIIDTSTGKHLDLGAVHNVTDVAQLEGLPDPTKSVLLACLTEESRRALTSLQRHVDSFEADTTPLHDDWQATRDLSSTLQYIQMRRVKEAGPLLKRLEELLVRHEMQVPDTVRLHTRQALRALGEVPLPNCGVRLYPMLKRDSFYTEDRDHPYRASAPLADRIANVDKIKAGMTIAEFTELLGCPDADVYESGRCYDYDIDAPEPFTLRVSLDQQQEKVKGVRRIAGFAFLSDPARMRE